MKSNKRDFGAFYALLRNHPNADKEELVLTYTGGRTAHLHEMKAHEFREMVDALARTDVSARTVQLKRARSQALLWIGRLGIETVDNWDGINAFCESSRIAGKSFRNLSIAELQALVRKLRAIHDKGGLKKDEPENTETPAESIIKLAITSNKYQS